MKVDSSRKSNELGPEVRAAASYILLSFVAFPHVGAGDSRIAIEPCKPYNRDTTIMPHAAATGTT
jgi:hypothetical protein